MCAPFLGSQYIMTTYIIMHDMIVEDEQHCDMKLSYNRECTKPLL